MEKIKLKKEYILIALIVIVALFCRLYKIDQFMTFLGDEGRDVRVVRDLLHGNLVFIGPQTSIGNMYLGPLYYYMVAPSLFIAGYNPAGPAIFIALLGTFTVFLTWLIGRTWFNRSTGLIAALLFALSPVAIIYSRSSWNPNPMPLFTLLSVWGIYKVWQKKKYRYLSVVGLSMAAALQMHYLGLLLLPTLGIFWLLTLLSFRAKRSEVEESLKKDFLRHTLVAIGLFLLVMSPLAFFDLKHNFMNYRAFQAFFSDRQTTINLNPVRSDRFDLIITQFTSDLVLSRQDSIAMAVGIALIVISVFVAFKIKTKKTYLVLLSWLFFGLLGLIVYKQHVYDHYYGFLFPAVYLLVGVIISYLFAQRHIVFKALSVFSFIALIYFALLASPLRGTPNRQLARTREIVQLIIKESNDQPFNFGLIAKQNYDESYRYFLENYNAKTFRGETKVTNQLFAVCEDGDSCQPEGNPAYQIAIFGPSHVVSKWNIGGINIYKLLHTK